MTTYGTIPTSSGGGGDGGGKAEFISRAKDRIIEGIGNRRPWREMFNFRSINFPRPLKQAFSRIKTNIGYFLMNYVIVILLILFLSLIGHPISLIVFVILMAVWLYLYFLRDEPLVIFGRVIDDRVVLAVLSVLTIVLLFLTHATINIILSLAVGIVVVLIHATLRKTDDLLLDEDEVSGGFLATARGPTPSSP